MGRLAELDTAAITDLPGTTFTEFADAFADRAIGLLQGAGERQIARYELALEAIRRPQLGAVLAEPTARIRELVAERFAALGLDDPHARATDFLVLVDGLLFDQLVAPWSRTLHHAEVRALVGRMLTAVDAAAI